MITTGKEARKLGHPKYFTGAACKYGHIAPRYAHNGQCTECGKLATAENRKKPKAKMVARAYYEGIREGSPEVIMWRSAKLRASRSGVPFSILPEDILVVWPADDVCPVLGVKMEHNYGEPGAPTGHKQNSPSLDKVIPELGYVRGNIVVMSLLANRLKQDVTDPAVFRKIADWLEKTNLCVKGA